MTTPAEVMEVYEQKSLAQCLLDEQKGMETSSERSNYDALCDEVITYARPDLIGVLGAQQNTEIEKAAKRGLAMQTSKVYTDIVLASHGYQTQTASPTSDWFSYRMVQPRLRDDDGVQAWLQKREERAYTTFRGCNFYPLQTSVWKDGLSLGNAPGMVEESQKLHGPVLKKFHPANTYFKCDSEGNYVVVHRRFWLSAAEAWTTFAPSREMLSEDILSALKDGNQWKMFEFIQCYRNQDDLLLQRFPYLYRTRPWNNIYIEVNAGSDRHKNQSTQGILRESGRGDGAVGGHHMMRFFNWRYDWDPEETYGRGPGQHGIVSIKRLHGVHKDISMAAQRAINSPVYADKMERGILDLNPGAVNWREDVNQKVERIYDRVDYPFGMDVLNGLTKEVEDLLHVALLRILTQSEKPMTAREATLLYQEKASLIAPAVQSHERDFLERCHAIFWQIDSQADPDYYRSMPDVLKAAYDEGGDVSIAVDFQGMLAQTQRAMVGVRRMEAALGTSEAILAIEPSVKDVVKWDLAFEKSLDDAGFWQDAINSEPEVKAIRKARLEEHMALVQAEVQQRMGAGAKSYAGATRELTESAA